MSVTFDEIKAVALSLGWDDVGITKAHVSKEDVLSYRQWLENGQHAELEYMEKEIRCYPEQLFPGAKTAIIFVTNYKQPKEVCKNNLNDSGERKAADGVVSDDAVVNTTAKEQNTSDAPRSCSNRLNYSYMLPRAEKSSAGLGLVASYAHGRDYHNVHRKRLKKFILWLEERSGQKDIAKGFSDSSPVLEKALAVQAGLGWFGKNTLLIHRRFGTFTLLSGVLTKLEIPHAPPTARLPRCGSCTRCIDACPTQALVSPYKLDAAKCLSYHLIESKKPIPDEIQRKNPGYIFGCDICQDSCPHNVRSPLSLAKEFEPESGIGRQISLELLDELEKNPEKLFGTPLQRRGVEGLKYNARTLLDKTVADGRI